MFDSPTAVMYPTRMANFDNCPNCNASLVGDPIPEESRRFYGDSTNFRKDIGMEVRGVYDGVLYWFCPACGWAWHRWDESNPSLAAKAQPYIDKACAQVPVSKRWDVV